MKDIIAKLTTIPAQIINIPAGTLSVGENADICIFDPNQYYLLDKEQFHSHGKNTPFHGWELKGRVTQTLVKGAVVFQRSS